MSSTIYDFSVQDAKGDTVSLETYKGKNIIIVNVASKCGFTPQYEGLGKKFTKKEKIRI